MDKGWIAFFEGASCLYPQSALKGATETTEWSDIRRNGCVSRYPMKSSRIRRRSCGASVARSRHRSQNPRICTQWEPHAPVSANYPTPS